MEIDWLRWTKRIQAIAQTGLAYTRDPFDIERYKELRSLATEMAAANLAQPPQQIAQIFANESGYATPKVDIRAVAFQDGRLLLVRERTDIDAGGFFDRREIPPLSIERVTPEEIALVFSHYDDPGRPADFD